MDSKVTIAIVAVVVAIVAIAGVAFFMMNNNDNGGAPSDGILYDGNGGKLSDGKTTYISHSTSVETCAFQKDGYHWIVWNTKADGSGTDYSENSVAPAKTTLYAQWSNANVLFGTDEGMDYVSIYVGDSAGGKEVNIDKGYATLSSNATFIIKPKAGVTLKMHVDGQSIIAEKSNENRDILYSTGTSGISFENGTKKSDGSIVFEIRQTIINKSVFLNYLSSAGFDVLDIGGTREVPTDVMTFSIGFDKTSGINIDRTGSVQLGEEAKIFVKAVKSGSTVTYDEEELVIKIAVSDKVYEINISFSNGGELTGVTVEGDTAIISFTYEDDKDPVFSRIIAS